MSESTTQPSANREYVESIAVQAAYTALHWTAHVHGLIPRGPMALRVRLLDVANLPAEVRKQFEDACRAVLAALGETK